MRRPVPRRSAIAPPYPDLDRRQKFALFGSIIGLILVGFALPQLMSFIGVRGDVLSGAFPPASAEPSSDPDDRRGFGGFQGDASPTPTPSPSSTPEPSPTPSGTLGGNPPPGAPVGPTDAPAPPVGPNPTPPPSTPTPVPPTPQPTPVPTTAPTSPPPTATPVLPTPTPTQTLPSDPPPVPPDAPTRAECSDGIDNDGDLFTDTGILGLPLLLGDPQCSGPTDNSERS